MQLRELPCDVLQRIFDGGDLRFRCALACTCRYYRALTRNPDFWREVDLDLGKLQKQGSSDEVAALLHFLGKRVSANTRLSLRCSTQPPDPYTPAYAEDSVWPRLSIGNLLMGVGINPGLKSLFLDLEKLSLHVQTEILKILPWLSTTLKELEVRNITIADASQLNALSRLSDLRRLALEFNSEAAALVRQPLQGGFPEKLASMTQLRHLSIHRGGYLGSLPDEIANLKLMETLDISNGSVLTGLPQTFSQLTALTSARIEHFGRGDLSGLAWLPQLQSLHLNGSQMPVELASCSQLTSLTLQLGAVPENQIEMGFSRMLGYSLQAEDCQQLLPLRAPRIPQLSQQLRVLHIADTKLSSVPQAVTQLPHLEHLSLTHCSLFDLPKGPYISKLHTLVLRQNFFIEIPQTLRGDAPQLEELDLSFNLLRPSEVDIETVLQLPSLRHLWITKTAPQPGPERFRQSLTTWTAYSMDCLFKLTARHAMQFPGCPLNLHIFEPRAADQ